MYLIFIDGGLIPGKRDEFIKAWNSQILPLLKKQDGFVDEILVAEEGSQQTCGLSFWKTREHAERYLREGFLQAKNSVEHLLQGTPHIRKFEVESAETFKIKQHKAA